MGKRRCHSLFAYYNGVCSFKKSTKPTAEFSKGDSRKKKDIIEWVQKQSQKEKDTLK